MSELLPYQQRFVTEYNELSEKQKKLANMLFKWDRGELNFTPTCSRELLVAQCFAMQAYLAILEERARIEKITL